MFPNTEQCPALKALYNDHQHQDAGYQAYWASQGPLLEALTPIFGLHNATGHGSWSDQTFALMYDEVASRHCHGMPMPCSPSGRECVTPEQRTQILANGEFEAYYAHRVSPFARNLTTLSIGTFLNEIIARLTAATMEGKAKRFHLFSGHDTTLIPLLGALEVGAEQFSWSPYASSMLLELWRLPEPGEGGGEGRGKGEHFVRILYNGELLRVPFCDMRRCPLLTFLRPAEQFIARDPSVCDV